MTLAECLNSAADLIEKQGWVQGSWTGQSEPGGPIAYCMIGAVRHLCTEQLLPSHKLSDLLGFCDIIEALNWNDDRGRKKEDVVRRLRRGAARAIGAPDGEIPWWMI